MPWQDLDTSDIVISDKSNDRIKKLRDKRKLTKWQTNQFEKRLRERYQETALRTSHTQWASVTEDKKHVNADDDISAKQETIQESGIVFARKASRLPPNVIEIVRLKDVNAAEPSDAVEMPLLMTAGLDKCLRFYSVGKDEESRKIHGIQCKSSLSVDAIKLNVNFMPHHTLYSFSSKASDLQGLVFT
jgi:hypothetical protein